MKNVGSVDGRWREGEALRKWAALWVWASAAQVRARGGGLRQLRRRRALKHPAPTKSHTYLGLELDQLLGPVVEVPAERVFDAGRERRGRRARAGAQAH